MRKWMKMLALLLVLSLGFGSVAFAAEAIADTTEIAGTYLLDAAPLGMPMQWNLIIGEDGSFEILTLKGDSKGQGTVGENEGIYMLLYDDAEAGEVKSATFEVVDGSLLFSTSVPIGKASISPQTVDDETLYPTALLIAYEELLGYYGGSFEKEAMGSQIKYELLVELKNGKQYEAVSSFEMGGTVYSLSEKGSFEVDGETITFQPKSLGDEEVELDAVSGTIVDGEITAAFQLSQMAAERQEMELVPAPTAAIADTYVYYYELPEMMGGGSYVCTMDINPFGVYQLTVTDEESGDVSYEEEGEVSFDAAEKSVAFLSAEGETPATGEYADFVISGEELKFPVSAEAAEMKTEYTLYGSPASGDFVAAGTVEDVDYEATLTLKNNTFTLVIEGGEGPYEMSGTFEPGATSLFVIEEGTNEAPSLQPLSPTM